jgi:hypothetical protein
MYAISAAFLLQFFKTDTSPYKESVMIYILKRMFRYQEYKKTLSYISSGTCKA